MLRRVIVCSDLTAEECKNLINNTIVDNPNNTIIFEMLIENPVSLISSRQLTTYTLVIQIEEDS